jgi:hypothetical protein
MTLDAPWYVPSTDLQAPTFKRSATTALNPVLTPAHLDGPVLGLMEQSGVCKGTCQTICLPDS